MDKYYLISDKFKRLMKDIQIENIQLDNELIHSFEENSNKILKILSSINDNEDEELKENFNLLLIEYNKIFNEIYKEYKIKRNGEY